MFHSAERRLVLFAGKRHPSLLVVQMMDMMVVQTEQLPTGVVFSQFFMSLEMRILGLLMACKKLVLLCKTV